MGLIIIDTIKKRSKRILVAVDLNKGVDGRDGVEDIVVVEVGKLDKEKELFDLDFVVLAIHVYHLAVQCLGNADGGAASGQHIVKEGDVEGVALGNTGSNVAEAVENMVAAIFLLDLDIVQVAFAVGQLPFLRIGITFCTNEECVSSGEAKRNPRASTVATLGQ